MEKNNTIMLNFFADHWETLVALITGGGLMRVVTMKSERKKAGADAMKAVQEVYRSTIMDMKGHIDFLKKDNSDTRRTVTNLQEDIRKITKDVETLKNYKCVSMDCKNRVRD